MLLGDDCSSCDGWGVNSGAVWTTNVVDGAIYFTTSGADSSNKKKTFGLYRAFGSAMTNGRNRVTFKAMLDSGTINFVVGDAVYKTTTMPFDNSKTMLTFAGTDVTGYNSLTPAITVDGDSAEQSVINALRWVDIDLIVDRDNERARLSVGGSEYVEYSDASFLPGSYAGTTWNYFGVSVPAQKSAYGYVDDVKVMKLASVEYDTVTIAAAVNDKTRGSATINGYATNSLTLYVYMYIYTNGAVYAESHAETSNADTVLEFDVEAGTTYTLWTCIYNRASTVTIKSIAYTYSVDVEYDTHNFVWNSAVASGEWNDAANWLYDGIVQASTYPSDVSCDVVTFNSAATVSFTSAGVASNVYLNAAVTFTSDADSGYGLSAAICAEISDDWETNNYRYMSTIKEL